MSNYIELRAEGYTIAEIAEKTKSKPQEIVDKLAQNKGKLKSLSAINEEAELNRCGATRKGRLKKIVALRDRLEEELSQRDLSDIPTDKLIALLLKVNENIRDEVAPPTIISNVLDMPFNGFDSVEIESV